MTRSSAASRTTPLRLRWDEFERLTATRGWTNNAERHRGLGISEPTLSALKAGTVRPGQKFVHACLKEFGGAVYDVLFEEDEAAA